MLLTMMASTVAWGQTRDTKTDVMDQSWTGVSGNTYTLVEDLDGSASSAVYTVQCAGGNSSIQLRSNNNNSGIVSTTSGGTATKVEVTWNSNTASGRTLNVYGNNTAYSAPSDLYDSSTQGTLIGTIVCGTSTELTITDSYEYIGMRSNSSAMYLAEIKVSWSTGSTPVVTHSLTFGPDNSNHGTVTVGNLNSPATVEEGAVLDIAATNGSGFVFTNWTVTGEGSSVADNSSPTTTFTMGTADATLTAHYTNIPTYTVTYHANVTGISPIEETYNEGEDVTIAANTFINSGYAFTKWNTLEGGTGTDYMPGDVINGIDDDIDLYAQWEQSNQTVDVLTNSNTIGQTTTSYSDWTATGTSAEYSGNSAGSNGTIQLRTNNNNSGVVSTASIGIVTKVSVVWNSSTNDARSLQVYGSNSAYTAASELYGSDAGTLLGTLNKGNGDTNLDITGDYAYIGIRSASGALYLDKIEITWTTGGTPIPSFTVENNNELTYNATSGSFNFTVNNPVSGGSVTVAESEDWISNPEINGNTVSFTTTENQGGTSREGVITLTYTYNTNETVTKDVTITQAGNPNATLTIAEVRAQGTGSVATKGVVTSINGTTAYIQDATAAIVVYGSNTPVVGDEIRVEGTLTTYKGLLEIGSNTAAPTVTVLSQGNTVTPTVMTIEDINTDAAGSNDYQAKLVRIEDATYNNGTVAQGNNSIAVYGTMSGVNDGDVVSFTANIGCHTNVQLVNMKDIEVQAIASITVAPTSIAAESAGTSGTIDITIDNMTITDVENQMTVEFFTPNGEPISEGNPEWIEFEFHLTSGNYSATYTIANNTATEARSTYFKVYGLDDDGTTEAYSNLVTVTQEAYVAPVASITIDPAVVNVTADEAEGNLAITLENIVITETGGGMFDYVICDAEGAALSDPTTVEAWLALDFPYENNAFSVYYVISENTTTEARTAYFKVYGVGDDGTTEAYSNLVTVTQEGVIAPVTTGTIVFGNNGTKINGANVSGDDSMGNTWNITTEGTTSFTQNAEYSQVGKSTEPATSIIFTTTLPQETIITAFEAKFGGFNSTAGDINLIIDETNVGSGVLNAGNDVTITNTSTAAGTILTVTVTNIAKGVKCYYISYTVSTSTEPMINAPATVNLESDATSGEIAYTIINPATGVSVTAASNDSWISDFVVTDDKVSFTTTANTETNERQGTITLSYEGANDKEVAIIQAAYVPPVEMENFALFTGNLVEGDYIIYYGGKAMNSTQTSNRLQYEVVESENNVIATDNVDIIWHIAPSGEYWTIYNATAAAYAASTGTKNQAAMLDDGTDDKALWTVSGTEVYEFVNKANDAANVNANLRNNGTFGFACYSTSTGGALTLYKKATTIASVEKSINGYANNDIPNGGYYLIASPVSVNPAEVTGMVEDTYDLYTFDQSVGVEEWRNYKANQFYLTPGKGYLYAKSVDVDLTFNGMPYEGNGQIELAFTEGNRFTGWNLIGNPFATNVVLNMPYYRLNSEGSALLTETESTEIAAMEGVFVKATASGQTAEFSASTRSMESKVIAKTNIMVRGSRGTVIDNAIVRFDGGSTLGKFQLNENSTKVYIPQDGNDYSIVNSDAQNEIPVNFKAAEDGTFTLDFSMENIEFGYFHLIDNKTGNDVDLLQTSSYTFESRRTDYVGRFRLVFNANDMGNIDGEEFAFINDGQIVINGTGTIQVIDMLGRQLYSQEVNSASRISNSEFTPGVYVLRLINGDDVKTQKIVVK